MSLNCKLALSTSGKMFDEKMLRSYRDSGIEAMEVSLSSKAYEDLDYSELKRLSDEYGVKLWSFHLPFTPFDEIDISKPALAEHTVSLLKKYIFKASEIGIKVFVLHASGEPITDEDRKERISCAKNSLKQLAEYASELGGVIAVEDLPRSCLGNNSKELLELVSVHNSLRVCFDTNHLLGESVTDFIKNVGDKIITLHVSDYDFINERHWLPGEGKNDWGAIISALEAVGYSGYWLYELGLSTPWSIERERTLTYADFKRNYDELMQNKPLTVIGKAKENLGMWQQSS